MSILGTSPSRRSAFLRGGGNSVATVMPRNIASELFVWRSKEILLTTYSGSTLALLGATFLASYREASIGGLSLTVLGVVGGISVFGFMLALLEWLVVRSLAPTGSSYSYYFRTVERQHLYLAIRATTVCAFLALMTMIIMDAKGSADFPWVPSF